MKLTIQRGMHRIALVVGLAGAVTGVLYIYYTELSQFWELRTAHERFELYLDLPAVQQEARRIADLYTKQTEREGKQQQPSQAGTIENSTSPSEFDPDTWMAKKKQAQSASSATDAALPPGEAFRRLRTGEVGTPGAIDYTRLAIEAGAISSTISIHRDGVAEATIDRTGVTAIQLSTGETIRPVPMPRPRLMLLPFASLIGFLFPWAAIRLFTWTASGFFKQD
jgi:hypothetical protein